MILKFLILNLLMRGKKAMPESRMDGKRSELDERTEKSSFRKSCLALQAAIHNWESSFGMPQISLDGDSMLASASCEVASA